VPVGAVLLAERVANAVAAGDHGTTYGGNLLACRAALTFIDVVEGGLLPSMRDASAHLFARLQALKAARPAVVTEVRGAGLIAGIEVTVDALAVVNAALERGLIINRTSGTVLRLLPPYVVTTEDIDRAIDVLDQALGAVA
jgi:acetylornithine/succinyldiaminopimelate/putrescine aminotransferase